jgi:hypothetical protein
VTQVLPSLLLLRSELRLVAAIFKIPPPPKMASSEEPRGAPPSSVTDAVLVPSNEMPKDAKKVEELDFNKFAGRPITVEDLISGMSTMGFQASSIGEAVRIINDMVRQHFSTRYFSNYFSTPVNPSSLPPSPFHILLASQQPSLL